MFTPRLPRHPRRNLFEGIPMRINIEVAGIRFNIDPKGFVTGGGAGFHIEDASKRFQMLAMAELHRLAIATKVTEVRNQTYRIMQMIQIDVVE